MFRLTLRGSRPQNAQSAAEQTPPEPDHAWKALSLVNDWIRHSDAKAGLTLAFTGALGAMLFNLAQDASIRSVLFNVVVVAACSLLFMTAALCAWTLTPRVNDRDAAPDSINRLFFASISRHFKGDRLRYAEVLSTLTSDPHELVKDLAHQIHANARIATVKAKYAQWAIRSAVAAGACVATAALIIGIASL
jgi:hypothetical protein